MDKLLVLSSASSISFSNELGVVKQLMRNLNKDFVFKKRLVLIIIKSLSKFWSKF